MQTDISATAVNRPIKNLAELAQRLRKMQIDKNFRDGYLCYRDDPAAEWVTSFAHTHLCPILEQADADGAFNGPEAGRLGQLIDYRGGASAFIPWLMELDRMTGRKFRLIGVRCDDRRQCRQHCHKPEAERCDAAEAIATALEYVGKKRKVVSLVKPLVEVTLNAKERAIDKFLRETPDANYTIQEIQSSVKIRGGKLHRETIAKWLESLAKKRRAVLLKDGKYTATLLLEK
jgi:hypothetical protein